MPSRRYQTIWNNVFTHYFTQLPLQLCSTCWSRSFFRGTESPIFSTAFRTSINWQVRKIEFSVRYNFWLKKTINDKAMERNWNTIVLFTFFPKLNPGENDETFRFLARANNMSETIWKYYIKITFIVLPIETFGLCIISILICFWLHGHFDTKHLFYFYKFA